MRWWIGNLIAGIALAIGICVANPDIGYSHAFIAIIIILTGQFIGDVVSRGSKS